MTSSDYMISIALCGITLLLEVLLLIDSFSTFASDVIQIKRIYDKDNDSVIGFAERMDAEMYKNKRATVQEK